MTHRTIHIRGWRVDVFIDDGGDSDFGIVTDCLFDMGAPEEIIGNAVEKYRMGKPNEAFTTTVGRRACIYIGWTTSGEEFLNSMIHEIRHLVDHIAAFYGLDNNEAVGYISGDAALLLAEDICEHGCPHCRKEEI